MPSRFIPRTGAVKEPVRSGAAELINATFLTKPEAAQLARCSTRFLERAVASGRLKALRPTSKFWRVRRSDLERFLESGATIGGGE